MPIFDHGIFDTDVFDTVTYKSGSAVGVVVFEAASAAIWIRRNRVILVT